MQPGHALEAVTRHPDAISWVGLAGLPEARPPGYARRIKGDALAMLRSGELHCESSLAVLRSGTALPCTS